MSEELPRIRITQRDYDRLESLLESSAARRVPGIDALQKELDRADIVEEAPAGEFITMGATAKFVEESSNRTHELTLVYPHESDGSSQKVSILAPVGSALLGLSVGQVISWPTQGGRTLRLRVLEIQQPPA